jgi:hypothetical protein
MTALRLTFQIDLWNNIQNMIEGKTKYRLCRLALELVFRLSICWIGTCFSVPEIFGGRGIKAVSLIRLASVVVMYILNCVFLGKT